MAKPFKIANVPQKNTNETKQVAAEPAGKQIVQSRQSGDPLPLADKAMHDPEIKWPPANSDRSPMKNMK